MTVPDKNKLYPYENMKTVCYISNLPKRPNVEIGEYTYYSDNKNSPENFYNSIEHHYEFLGDKLIIGKFCAIAEGIKFIMNGANHRMDGITTYPFNIFAGGWEKVTPIVEQLPFKGDTVIGNDVWIGQNVTIMPGVKIGDGAIIATNSTVTKNIESYSIYGGNPAKFIKKRFSDNKIEFLQKLQWWNWDEEKIFINLEKLTSGIGLDQVE
jgi:virginiamycin A acetyltransferase